MTVLALQPEQELLVAAYAADLKAAGMRVDHPVLWGARAFCARFGSADGWNAASLDQQLAENVKVHRFVSWLVATRRLRPTADYLVARRVHLGDIVARHYPAFFASFEATALELGFGIASVRRQWFALTQACALHGLPPDELLHAHLDEARVELRAAAVRGGTGTKRGLRSAMFGLQATMFHLGTTDQLPRRQTPDKASERAQEWLELEAAAPQLVATVKRYLEQIALSLRAGTVDRHEGALREFARVVVERDGPVHGAADITRRHIEDYKAWLADRPAQRGPKLHRHTIRDRLGVVRNFFERLIEWGWDDVPARVPLCAADLPIPDQSLPRFLDDAAATKLLRATRADLDPFVRLCVEFLARTGLRKGEFLALTVDAIVQIGSAYWLRVPVGKLHNDRYIPLHPQLKELLDHWLERRPDGLRSDLMFVEHGRRIAESRVDRAVAKVAEAAGIGHVSPHQLRHTLATQAINRGMSLEAIAALLGHRSLRMTLVYARIADRTVADEYFRVSEKVEALYDQPKQLPASAEGAEMARLRREVHRRMLGNGYCARPVTMDCHFESICESCSFFVTTAEFRPTLQRQRDDAAARGQVGRQKIFEGLLSRLQEDAS